MTPSPEIILDITRLVSRAGADRPTGIDRVEMEYARGLLAARPGSIRFAAVNALGVYGPIPNKAAIAFLDETEARWKSGAASSDMAQRRRLVTAQFMIRPWLRARPPGKRIFVQASHSNLDPATLMERILAREQAALVTLVYDLIPILFPEYARPGIAEIHKRRMATVVGLSDGIATISQSVLDTLQPLLVESGRTPLTRAALLGTRAASNMRPASADRPYFVCVGTIEPRKNHILLLHLWRAWAERSDSDRLPRLIIVGKRGWENEQIVDLLDRCWRIEGLVVERTDLSDDALEALIKGARALLMPSFVEGFGMPITEALALGIPVIASDIAAHREAGGSAPDYLDPNDGAAWAQVVRDYTLDASPRRDAQLARMGDITLPTWEQHMAILLDLIDRVAAT